MRIAVIFFFTRLSSQIDKRYVCFSILDDKNNSYGIQLIKHMTNICDTTDIVLQNKGVFDIRATIIEEIVLR